MNFGIAIFLQPGLAILILLHHSSVSANPTGLDAKLSHRWAWIHLHHLDLYPITGQCPLNQLSSLGIISSRKVGLGGLIQKLAGR